MRHCVSDFNFFTLFLVGVLNTDKSDKSSSNSVFTVNTTNEKSFHDIQGFITEKYTIFYNDSLRIVNSHT